MRKNKNNKAYSTPRFIMRIKHSNMYALILKSVMQYVNKIVEDVLKQYRAF